MSQIAVSHQLSAVGHQPDGPWLSVADAAIRMGCTERRVRQLCQGQWAAVRLAKVEQGQWLIHPAADQRLRTDVDVAQRDRQQLAGMAKSGTKPAALDRAEALRDIIRGLADFQAEAPNPRKLREFYLAHLKASGKLASAGIKKLSVSRFYVLEALYREQGVAGLVRKSRETQGLAMSQGSAALDYVFNLVHCGNRISLAYAIELARGEATKHPGDPAWTIGSYSSIRLAINDRSPQILRVLAGKGERKAKADCLPKLQRHFPDIPAGDEYVGDERTLDIWCRVLTSRGWRAIRPKCTAWMDMRSRMVVGHVLAHRANTRTILGSLKLAIREYGKPLVLRTDWGEDYKSIVHHGLPKTKRTRDGFNSLNEFDGRRLFSIFEELGIQVARTSEPYSPYAKPIESLFRGQKNRLDRLFASFWGGCPSERHEDRQRYLRENMEKLPILDAIDAALMQDIDNYHRRAHSAPDMFGKSPLEAMAAFREGPVRTETPEVLDHVFREFIGPFLVRRDGIRHNAAWYGNGDARLVAMRDGRRKVMLGIQPEDQGRALVCDLDRTPLFEVECPSLLGRTREEVSEMIRSRRRMIRPYKEQAAEAHAFIVGTTPQALLDNAARAIAADASAGRIPAEHPHLTVVRPALQESIAKVDRAARKQAAITARTGTDDDEISLEDLVGPMEGYQAVTVSPDTDDDEGLSYAELTGEDFDA